MLYFCQCENKIKTLQSKIVLSSDEDDGDQHEREDVKSGSDEDDDEEETTLMSRTKNFANQVIFNSTFFKFLIGIPNICYKIYGQGK